MKKEVKEIIDQRIENNKSILDDIPPPIPSLQPLNDPQTWTAKRFPKYLTLYRRGVGVVRVDQEELEKYIICKSINELETLLKEQTHTQKKKYYYFL